MSICEEDIIVDTSTASAQRVEAESLPGPSSSADSADYTPVRISCTICLVEIQVLRGIFFGEVWRNLSAIGRIMAFYAAASILHLEVPRLTF